MLIVPVIAAWARLDSLAFALDRQSSCPIPFSKLPTFRSRPTRLGLEGSRAGGISVAEVRRGWVAVVPKCMMFRQLCCWKQQWRWICPQPSQRSKAGPTIGCSWCRPCSFAISPTIKRFSATLAHLDSGSGMSIMRIASTAQLDSETSTCSWLIRQQQQPANSRIGM